MKLCSNDDGFHREDVLPSLEDMADRLSQGESNNDLCEDGLDLITPTSFYAPLNLPPTSMLSTSNMNPGNPEDDVVLGASRRLRAAVDKILNILSDIVTSHECHDVQELLRKNEDLNVELNEEVVRREKLTNDLIKTEEQLASLLEKSCYWEEQLQDYNEIKRQNKDLERKLEEYQSERQKWIEDKITLEKDKNAFASGLPQLHQSN